MGEVSEDDLNNPRFAYYEPGDVVGKAGVEETYDELLARAGRIRDVIVDSHGREVGYIGIQHAIPGQDLRLTIDNDLQRAAELALGDRNGAIVAMDPRNGEILAMVSRPSFDPNAVCRQDRPQRMEQAAHRSRPSADEQEPSRPSLRRGRRSKFSCRWPACRKASRRTCKVMHRRMGTLRLLPPLRRTSWRGGHSQRDSLLVRHVLLHAGRQAGHRSHCEVRRREFGYGQKTGIDLPGEQAGLMPSAQWKMKNYHARWYPDETLDVSIGQGAVEATPIQLARIIGGIASGGHMVRPHVVFPDQLPEDFRKALTESFPGSGEAYIPIDPDNWQIVTDGMYQVTQPGLYHTAGGEHLDGIDFGGKTGTAQVMSHEALDKTNKGQIHEPERVVCGRDAHAQS